MSNSLLSEQYRLKGLEWSEADRAASLLEELKTATLSQMKAKLGDMPDSRAETRVKASPEWEDYIRTMVEARHVANDMRVELEAVRMRHREWIGEDANKRAEMKL